MPGLKPHEVREGMCLKNGMQGRGQNRILGNPTVRDRRGASGNVAYGEIRNPRCNRKGNVVTLRLSACAPEIYPDICMLRSVGVGVPIWCPFYPAELETVNRHRSQ